MQVRAKIFHIMGFYNILYNISNFSFGPNFPFNLFQNINRTEKKFVEFSIANEVS